MDEFDNQERRALAALVRSFTETEIVPGLREWEAAGDLPRSLHERAGDLGLLGLSYPEEVGGSGGDLLDVVVMTEEILAGGGSGGLIAGLFTHGISIPHVVDAAARRRADADLTSGPADAEILVDRVIRPTLTGRAITWLAVTEPDGGSDVGGLRTAAVRLDAAAAERVHLDVGLVAAEQEVEQRHFDARDVVAVLTVFGVAADGLDPEQIVDTIEGAVVILTALMAQRHVTKPD